MAKRELYQISGHWEHYQDGMFIFGDPQAEGEVFALRPMTCPFQYAVHKNGMKSYRDLPKRYAETSTLFGRDARTDTRKTVYHFRRPFNVYAVATRIGIQKLPRTCEVLS